MRLSLSSDFRRPARVPGLRAAIRLALLAVVIAVMVVPVAAQTPGATVTGVITDETGAAVANVTVTLEPATGASRSASTNGQGAYTFAAVPPGTYVLHAARTGFAPGRVEAITVAAGEQRTAHLTLTVATVSEQVSVTAPVGGYTTGAVTIGKTTTSLRQTPQSMSVVTRERLDDQNFTDVGEALRSTTGVTVFSNGGAYTDFGADARGVAGDFQADGMNMDVDTRAAMFDLFVYDRVEVLRGPAGLFKGAGSAGMTTNLVRKSALAPFRVNGSIGVGSWGTVRTEADITGSLSASGRVRARAVMVAENRGSHLNGVDNEKLLGYGTVDVDITPRTILSASGTVQRADMDFFFGLPAYPDGRLVDVARATSFTSDWAYGDLSNGDLFLGLEHRFTGGGQLKVAARRTNSVRDAESLFSGGGFTNAGRLNLSANKERIETDNTSADAYLSLPVRAWGLTHNVLVGTDVVRFSQESVRRAPSTLGNVDFFTLDPATVARPNFEALDPLLDSQADTTSFGTYGQVRIKPVAAVTLIGAGRFSVRDVENHNRLNNTTTIGPDIDGEFTPYAAAVVDVSRRFSLYTSYAQVFEPQNSTMVTGELLPPVVGAQVEGGIKGEVFGGANLHAAFYRTVRSNEALADPDNPGFTIADGKRRAQGFETEISGQLSEGWNLTAGYAYTTTKILVAAVTQTGLPFSPRTPEHNFSAWTSYTLPASVLRGLQIGGGVRALSGFYTLAGTVRFEAEPYAVDSWLVGYRIGDHLRATFNAENLFDQTYYAKVGNVTANNYYGTPRRLTLTLRVM